MNDEVENGALEKEVDRQVRELERGTVQIVSVNELRAKLRRSLREGKPLRVKLGVDPTAHDLHLGFTLPLTKLRIFADLGHQPVLIIGDATAMVGDPTGRSKMRPQLTRDDVDAYAASYLDQASRILDLQGVEIRRNSEWLEALGFSGLIKLAAQATVAQLLVREDFSKRYSEGTPIYLHEFIYPLLQGHDSVVVRADVELGGQDQLFNLLIGRDLQLAAGQEPQVCMMGPLLVGLDGVRKMSKSFQNYIGVSEAPDSMFGKVMSLPDTVMRDWFELATDEPLDRIEAAFGSGAHPREMKDALARAIVRRYHGEAAAAAASDNFRRVFTRRELPEEIADLVVPPESLEDGKIWIVRLLVLGGFAATNGEARRLVAQGGVKIDDQAIGDESVMVPVSGGEILKVGKRRFARLISG